VHIHLTPTALAKAKALGIVAAALTAGGAGGMVALSQVSNAGSSTEIVASSDATTPPSAEPTDAASPSPTPTETEPTTDPATDSASTAPAASSYALPSCPSDVKNHGAYVSGVAHSAPNTGEHGTRVSQAAHSDCGKSADSSVKPEPKGTEHPDSPESHSPTPAHTKAEKTDSPEATKTAEDGASVSGSAGGQHKSGHGDH
jgi:cell division protein FtsN